jgi:ribosome biogenesis GTPase
LLNTLEDWGWTKTFESAFRPYHESLLVQGRVVEEQKDLYQIWTTFGFLQARVTGKLRYRALGREDFPAVGDWVVVQARPEEGQASIQDILPRQSSFSRKRVGNLVEEQIVASNVDLVFLLTALNQDFNLRRMERYLTLAWSSGATPIILLTKADLCENVLEKIEAVERIALDVPVHAISCLDQQEEGVAALSFYFKKGKTIALLGSSGVGKSTLINHLLGRSLQKVQDIRSADDRGRHTTSHRQLFQLPCGTLIMDTPGMREIQLWDAEEGLEETFEDIEVFAQNCRFRDCQHQQEPGCAIQNALEEGTLEEDRYESYQKLKRELAFLERKNDPVKQAKERERWKKIGKIGKNKAKMKYR